MQRITPAFSVAPVSASKSTAPAAPSEVAFSMPRFAMATSRFATALRILPGDLLLPGLDHIWGGRVNGRDQPAGPRRLRLAPGNTHLRHPGSRAAAIRDPVAPLHRRL